MAKHFDMKTIHLATGQRKAWEGHFAAVRAWLADRGNKWATAEAIRKATGLSEGQLSGVTSNARAAFERRRDPSGSISWRLSRDEYESE